MKEWQTKNFSDYNKPIVASQLADFLNRHKITEFKVVTSIKGYMEIIYLSEEPYAR